MPTTLSVESFSETNIRERTVLTAAAGIGDISLQVDSTQGYNNGAIIYVGRLSSEGCEKAVIQNVASAATLTLTIALALPHNRFEAVSSVVGDKIHIYRALNIDGTVPADAAFSVLATRTIDPDQLSTYYTDSSGDSWYWYRFTYFNETTLEATDPGESDPRRATTSATTPA